MDPRTTQTSPPYTRLFDPQWASWTTQFAPTTLAPQLPQFAQQAFAVYRTAFDTWLAITNAALAGAERVRMAQLATDVETMGQNHRAAAELAASKDLPGLLAVQSGLARAYLDGCARYWTAVADAMQSTQAEVTHLLAARTGSEEAAAPRAATETAVVDRKAA